MISNNSFIEEIVCFIKQLFNRGTNNRNFVSKVSDPMIIKLSSKSKTRDKLAKEYGYSVKTLNRRFEKHNLKIPQGLICPVDLRRIYETLGLPGNIKTG
jgi:hypothetical protein